MFVFTLITLSTIVTILAGIAAVRRVEFRAVVNRMDEVRAEHVAMVGIQRCLSLIQEHLTSGQVAWTMADNWARFGEEGSQRFNYGGSAVRLEIVDAASFVNLNTATQAQLERLPLTVEQVESLLDWREAGFISRPGGAKDEYYNQLPNPYNAKLAPLSSVEELLLIKGFTPATLYALPAGLRTTAPPLTNVLGREPVLAELVTVSSRSANVAADGQPKLNVNTASTQALIARGIPLQLALQIVQRRNAQGTFVRLGDVLSVPGVNNQNARAIVDNLTVTSAAEIEGQINVNTASEAVLTTLPGITEDIAQAIVQLQSIGFASLGALFDVPGVNTATIAPVVDQLTVNSRAFLVRAMGQHGNVRVAIEATVRIIDNEPRVVAIKRLSPSRALELWYWAEEATAEVEFGGIS